MATVDRYKIVVDVDGQQNVDKLKNTLSGFGTLIAGIGFASFAKGVLQMADAMNDLADATGLAVKDIAAFESAIMLAGGSSEASGKMLASFYQQLDKAAQGSEQAQKALERVGISFADLGRLSERDLLSKALQSLAAMPAGAERTAAGMEVLGKAFKNLDPKQLSAIFESGANINAEAIQKLAQAADNLAYNFKQLQLAGANVFAGIMSALEPFIGKLENGRLSIEQAEKSIKLIGAAIAIVFGAQAIAMVAGFVTAILNLNKALMATALVTNLLGKNPLIKILGGIAVAAGVGAIAWDQYEKALKDVEKAQNDVKDSAPTVGTPAAFPNAQLLSDAEKKSMKQAEDSAKLQTAALKEQNAQALKYQQTVNNTIGLESNLASYLQNNAQIEQTSSDKRIQLEKQIQIEKDKGRTSSKEVINQLQQQIGLINEQENSLKRVSAENYELLQAERQRSLIAQDKATANARQTELDLMQLQIQSANAITVQEQSAYKLLQLQVQEQQKIKDLEEALEAAIRSKDSILEASIRRRIDGEKAYYSTLRDLENQRMQQEIANRENRELGIKRVLEQVERNFDPIKVAGEQTQLLFDRMGQGIEEFAKTGKLNFKDFALSIIRDMLLIEIKATASKFLSMLFKNMLGGGFGTGNAFGNLDLGMFLAEGGPAKAGKPYIVGERGPELFVPKSAGTVIPNNQMGSRGVSAGAVSAPITNNYVTNNVNAIDSQSVAQFFANNRKLMLGSVEMARKEMPYGMSR